MTIETITDAVQELGQSFQQFKDQQETKLTALEQKMQRQHLVSNRPQTNMDMTLADDTAVKSLKDFVRSGLEMKGLSTTEGGQGGFMVPQVIQDRITAAVREQGSLRSIASVTTITSSSVDILVDRNLPDVGWAAELEERSETDTPEIYKVHIPVHEMYAKPRASQKLLDDAAINVEDWLVQKVAERMHRLENEAFIQGDGDKKPVGFLTYEDISTDDEPGKIQHILTGVDGNFGEGSAADFLINMVYSLKAKYLSGASWVMSRTAQALIMKIKTEETGQFLWQPSLTAGTPPTLLGYPVLILDEMPSFLDGMPCTPIAFGNFKEGYQIVDRTDMTVLRDPYSAKPHVEFYITKRVGGNVVNPEAIKILSFSKKLQDDDNKSQKSKKGGAGAGAGAGAEVAST